MAIEGEERICGRCEIRVASELPDSTTEGTDYDQLCIVCADLAREGRL